jgi:hypothetical protein
MFITIPETLSDCELVQQCAGYAGTTLTHSSTYITRSRPGTGDA